MNIPLRVLFSAFAVFLLVPSAFATTIDGLPGGPVNSGAGGPLGSGGAQWYTNAGGIPFEVPPPAGTGEVPAPPRPPGFTLAVGSFTGVIDVTLSTFVPFIPSTSDSFAITDPAPTSPPFAPGQLVGKLDDDGDGGDYTGGVFDGGSMNTALTGLPIYLVVEVPGGSAAAGGPLPQIGVFTSTAWPVFPTNVGTGGGPSGTALPTADDISISQNLVDTVAIGSFTLAAGPGGENFLSLAVVPEPSRGLLSGLALAGIFLRRRRP